MTPNQPHLLTVGHGTADRTALTKLLAGADAGLLVDVRRFPGSRRNPDVSSDALAQWLPEIGVTYRWEPRLGGRRRLPAGQESEDPWWQVEAFRAYAAYTRTAEFREAMADLLRDVAAGAPRSTLVMCSESLWWRCHRRLISDALLVRGWDVQHIGPDGRLTEHELPEFAVVEDGRLTYPPAQLSL